MRLSPSQKRYGSLPPARRLDARPAQQRISGTAGAYESAEPFEPGVPLAPDHAIRVRCSTRCRADPDRVKALVARRESSATRATNSAGAWWGTANLAERFCVHLDRRVRPPKGTCPFVTASTNKHTTRRSTRHCADRQQTSDIAPSRLGAPDAREQHLVWISLSSTPDARASRGLTRRGFALVVIPVGAALLVGISAPFVYLHSMNHANTACGRTPPDRPSPARTSGWHVRWDWTPPGFVCVYTNRAGNVVTERRPD